MRIVKKTFEIFKFDELKKDIQEIVVMKMYDINVDYEWWENNDIYHEIAKDYGLEIVMSEMCFDLDRSNYCYFDTYNHSNKENYKKG